MNDRCAEREPTGAAAVRGRRRSRPAPPPLVLSPVALAIVSLFRGARRGLSGRSRSGLLPAFAVIGAVASVGLWLPGPGSRVAGDAPVDVATDPARANGAIVPDPPAPLDVATESPAARPPPGEVATPAASSASAASVPSEARASSAAPEPGGATMPGASPGPVASVTPDVRAPGPDGPETSVPADRHARVVREKRELEARVAALEKETTALESEMLALDLQLVAVDSAARDAGVDLDALGGATADVSAASAPIELGNTTLVPAPLTGLGRAGTDTGTGTSPAGDSDAGTAAPTAPFDVSGETGAFAEASSASDPFLPQASPDVASAPTVEGLPAPAPIARDGGGGARAAASADVGMPVERLVVAEVPYGSGADDAGLLPGDILLAIDDSPVTTLADVDAYAASGEPAPMHELELLRDGRRQWVALASSPARLSLVSRRIDPARLAVD